MSTSLHDALADLADEIGPQDVPAVLAERAWEGGRVERRQSIGRRSVALLAAAAAVVLLTWVSVGGVSRVDTAPATPTGPVGYPERVRFQADPPQLPVRSGPVAAVLAVGVDDEAAAEEDDPISYPTVNGGSSWQAVLPTGGLRSLDDVVPAGDLRADRSSEIVGPVALSPDGTKIAAIRQTATVLGGSAYRDVGYALHLHDLRTGEHHVVEGRRVGLSEAPQNVLWSPDGQRVAVRTDARGQGVAVISAAGHVVAQVDRTSAPARTSGATSVYLAGWTDDDTVLLVSRAREGALHPTVLDVISGELRQLPRQPADEDSALYGDGAYAAASNVTVHHGALAVLRHSETRPGWTLYTDPRRTGDTSSALSCCEGTGQGLADRALYSPGGGMLAVAVVDGTRTVAGSFSFEGSSDEVRTVVDPSLGAGQVVLAEEVYAQGRASRSLFGTWDLWVIWHPWWTALGVAGVALVLWWILRDSTRAVRPPRRERRRSRA